MTKHKKKEVLPVAEKQAEPVVEKNEDKTEIRGNAIIAQFKDEQTGYYYVTDAVRTTYKLNKQEYDAL